MTLHRIEHLRTIAHAAHRGQVDKQCRPYAEHLDAVAGAVSDDAKPVALFHDAIEDERMTRGALAGLLDTDEFAAVELLTRPEGMPYAVYVDRIRSASGRAGELAREVKRADLAHNLGRLTPELESLRGRYENARAILAERPAPRRPEGQAGR